MRSGWLPHAVPLFLDLPRFLLTLIPKHPVAARDSLGYHRSREGSEAVYVCTSTLMWLVQDEVFTADLVFGPSHMIYHPIEPQQSRRQQG